MEILRMEKCNGLMDEWLDSGRLVNLYLKVINFGVVLCMYCVFLLIGECFDEWDGGDIVGLGHMQV